MLEKLSIDEPNLRKLKRFLKRLHESYQVHAVIVFGSVSKGTWNYRSDLDMLIISDSMGDNWFDRGLSAYTLSEGGIQPFVLTTKEFLSAIRDRRYIVWEALHDGIILRDDGIFSNMKAKFFKMIESKFIQKRPQGWTIFDDAVLEQPIEELAN